jgi:purine-binding chemotaxis protein CheW
MKTDSRQYQVLNQQLALRAYLDALLGEALPPPVSSPSGPAEPVTSVAEQTVAPAVVATGHGVVPDWAESRFQALLFEVAGLTLAVPLVKLKGVVSSAEALTPMPGHSPLFLGVVPYQGLQSKVVDTARFVLPADQAAQLPEDAAERCRKLVMIDEGRWALACSGIGDVVELGSADVKWRGVTGKRLWLAGTVIERMCALLDLDQLTGELAGGTR